MTGLHHTQAGRRRPGVPALLRAAGLASALALAASGALAADPAAKDAAAQKAKSPVASYLSGRMAQGAGDWGTAARHLTEALKADPGNVQLIRRTFLLQLGAGRYGEAIELARRLDQGGAESYLAGSLLVADAVKRGQAAEAAERLAKLPSDGLGQYISPLLTAWTRMAAGDRAGALAALEALDKAPGFAALRALQAGLVEDVGGNEAGARDWYAKAVEGGAPLRLTLLVGNFHARAGRAGEARAVYEAFLADNPGNASVEAALAELKSGAKPARMVADARDGLAEALFDVAGALHQENASEMALLYGRVSLHLRGDQPMARMMVADVLANRNRPDEALAEYRAITADPGLMWTVRLRQVDVLRRTDRAEEAAKLLEAMAAERPDRTDALVRLGDLRRGAAKHEAALAAYDRALQRVKAPRAVDWPLFYARAMALDELGRWPQAEADLMKALELNPDQPHLLNYLGYSWVDRNQNLDRAKAMIEKAVSLRPNDGYIMDSLGWAKFRMGDVEGAMQTLEKAVQLKPLDPTINDHLGDVYWAAGRHKEARFQWSRAAQHAQEAALKSAVEEKLRREVPARKTALHDGE
ncbi:MAG TPA: tetratricopeptide repeat protein [Azospirillaceae bacterium]|nr:tetratricopeptide repeat protein [Azospirillaceae bacterium]